MTAATGQLGGPVVKSLLEAMPAERVIARVRDASKASFLEHLGVAVLALLLQLGERGKRRLDRALALALPEDP